MRQRPRAPGWLLRTACALSFAAAWLVGPLTGTGASDPYEADAADLARRIAVHAFGAADLARPGDPAGLPTLTDLGMGELPFTSMALSFRVFGFHEWSGRLPLALWGLAGAVCLYFFLQRLVSARAGFFAVIALSTMPLYFLHARTMAGEIVTMASLSMAVSGLALGVTETSRKARAIALSAGVLGLAAGFLTRGLLLGVAVPLATTGIAALVSRGSIVRGTWARGLAGTFVLGALGSAAVFLGVALPKVEQGQPLSRIVGVVLHDPTARDSTFDRMIRQIGYALYPWSVVLPIAVARLAGLDRSAASREPDEAASFAKTVLLTGATTSLLAHTFLVPWTGALPFAGVAMLAGAVGVMAAEHDMWGASKLAPLVVAMTALVLAVDLDREPSRALASFEPTPPAFPLSFVEPGRLTLYVVAGLATVVPIFMLLDGATLTPSRKGSLRAAARAWREARREEARRAGRAFYEAFRGNLVFAAVVLEAWLIGQAAMVAIGGRAGWEQIRKLPASAVTLLVNAWWAVPLGLLGSVLGYVLMRDGLRLVSRSTRLSRGALLMLALGSAGTVLSVGYYTRLGEQLSPRGSFEVYRATRREGEPLALLGTSLRAGALYFRDPLPTFTDVAAASAWLAEPGAPRRFLILKAKDLPRLNSLWRERYRKSVGVLDARSSQNVLVSNVGGQTLGSDPFGELLFDAVPATARPLSARFLEHIELVGWELVDEQGEPVDAVVPGQTFRARFYLKVLERVPGSWMTFLHVDGHGKRYNADHTPLGGRYPMNLWQPGDIVRDEVEVTLEPNFAPGEYWVYFGFFQGESRMRVTHGPHRDDRVVAGRITVR